MDPRQRRKTMNENEKKCISCGERVTYARALYDVPRCYKCLPPQNTSISPDAERPPDPKYQERVVVTIGPDWRARPGYEADKNCGEVLWWGRRLRASEMVRLADVIDLLADYLDEYEPPDGPVFANWDDTLVALKHSEVVCFELIMSALDRIFKSEVMELAPGLDPKTGHIEETRR